MKINERDFLRTGCELIMLVCVIACCIEIARLTNINATLKDEIISLQEILTSGESCVSVCNELFNDWGC